MEYTYKDMLVRAQQQGQASEKLMWESVDSLSEMLCVIKREHPDMYWAFLREQHGVLYKKHYDQEFAEWDVSQISYTDKAGNPKHGAHWSVEQVESATAHMKFPIGTTKWDKYVAFNAAYADFCKKFDEAQVLDIAFSFYFADEDWGTTTKIWEYYCMKNKKP